MHSKDCVNACACVRACCATSMQQNKSKRIIFAKTLSTARSIRVLENTIHTRIILCGLCGTYVHSQFANAHSTCVRTRNARKRTHMHAQTDARRTHSSTGRLYTLQPYICVYVLDALLILCLMRECLRRANVCVSVCVFLVL